MSSSLKPQCGCGIDASGAESRQITGQQADSKKQKQQHR
jgi:hypothetical protein